MELSLVIPAYNEGAIIKDTVEAALTALSGKFDGFELIVVDDGSTDGTKEILSQLSGSVTLISCAGNRGKGFAVKTGMLAARGDIVFFTDADLAYGLDIIETGAKLLGETGADIVAGSRKLEKNGYAGYPAPRLIASKCFSLILRAVTGMKYDTQCGVKGFKKRAADEIFNSCETDGFSFDFEAMAFAQRHGYRIVEMPVKILNHRDSRVSLARDGLRMLVEVAGIRRKMRRKDQFKWR